VHALIKSNELNNQIKQVAIDTSLDLKAIKKNIGKVSAFMTKQVKSLVLWVIGKKYQPL
jgi:hypothetical protein